MVGSTPTKMRNIKKDWKQSFQQGGNSGVPQQAERNLTGQDCPSLKTQADAFPLELILRPDRLTIL